VLEYKNYSILKLIKKACELSHAFSEQNNKLFETIFVEELSVLNSAQYGYEFPDDVLPRSTAETLEAESDI
jgi:hypothetical protein